MSIRSSIPVQDRSLNSDEFVKVVSDYLPMLRQKAAETGNIATATIHEAMRHRGDLYGLLIQLGVSRDVLAVTARLNGYMSSADYDGSEVHFLLPDDVLTAQILTAIKTKVRN